MHPKLVAGALLVCTACASPPPDVEPCGTIELGDSRTIWRIDQVDLLVVIDDSASMSESRGWLATEIPRLALVLASGDRDGDGVQDFAPASLHLGVITTDLGATVAAAGCGEGGDGLLVRASADADGCGDELPSGSFAFEPETDDAVAFANDVGCSALARDVGCGVEQPLEAALRALSLAEPTDWSQEGYEPPTFADGSFGHGDGANAGFLRPRSVLAIVVITDEDDCSVSDTGAELTGVAADEADPSCAGTGGLLPIERMVEGLMGLRRQPSLVTFTVVGGVPPALVDRGYETILAAPEMQPTLDPARPGQLQASCTSLGGREARPPHRLVEVAQALERRGARTSIASICGDSLVSAVDVVIESTAIALVGYGCLPRAIELDDEGRADCRVDAILAPAGSGFTVTSCAQIEGALRLEDDLGPWEGRPAVREVCRIPALSRAEVASTRPGWFYDDGDPRLGAASMRPDGCDQNVDASRVAFNGSELRVECRARSGDRAYCE